MKKRILVLMLTVWKLSAARADVWSDYSNAYTDSLIKTEKNAIKEEKQANQAKAKLEKAAAALKAQQEAEQAELNQENAEVATLQAQQDKLQNAVTKLTPPDGEALPLRKKNWLGFSKKSPQEKALNQDEKQLNTVNAQLEAQNAAIQKTKLQLKASQTSLAAAQTQADAAAANFLQVNAANEDKIPPSQAVQVATAQATALGLFAQQKQSTFDSKLLFSNLQNLELQGKMSKVEVDAIRKEWNAAPQLNGTLIGDYVNGQIQRGLAASCDPDFQAACTTKNAAGMNKAIAGLLNPAQAPDPRAESSAQQKELPASSAPAEETKPAAVAAPANQ